jgi:transposase
MRSHTQSNPKCESLRRSTTLNPHPERVSDALFQSHPFFDPRDLVQVKYEMLRRVVTDGQPVGSTAAAFGFSRMGFFQLRKRFHAEGLFGLLPQPKGPRRSHKLSDEILTWIENTLQTEPELRLHDLPGRVQEQFGVSIYLRSIERALARQRKKELPVAKHLVRGLPQTADLHRSACSNTSSSAARPWWLATHPALWLWKYLSLNGRGLRLGWRSTGVNHRLPTMEFVEHPPLWIRPTIWLWRWPIWC